MRRAGGAFVMMCNVLGENAAAGIVVGASNTMRCIIEEILNKAEEFWHW